MKMAGHRSIQNMATMVQDAEGLDEAGIERICELNGAKVLRKRK